MAQIEIPSRYLEEYHRQQGALIRSRVRLTCLVTTSLFFFVSLQYLIRKAVFHVDTFRAAELPFWAVLLAGTVALIFFNQNASSIRAGKLCGFLYTAVFIAALTGVGVVYRDNAIVFVFYYAFSLLLSSMMIPWSLSDVFHLTGMYMTAFTFYYFYVTLYLKYPIPSLSRFHPYVDGVIFIGIAYLICLVIRKKENERMVENFVLLKEIEEKNRQIEDELELARRVHKTLIPDSIQTDQVDIAVSYVPMGYVGGDYAKFKFLDKHRLVFFISDVTGHGMPAALLVNRVHAEFERLAQPDVQPADLLKELNRFISKDFEGTHMYLSAFCGLLDFKTMKFVYSNYGHPNQYIYHGRDATVKKLGSQTTFVGISMEGDEGRHEAELSFERGDRILLFTDGVIETVNAQNEFFGETKLINFLKQNHAVSHEELNDRLIEELNRFKEGNFKDDIFILNLKTKKG